LDIFGISPELVLRLFRMPCVRISAKLPASIIEELTACEGVIVRGDSSIIVIEIVNSEAGKAVHKRFLTTDPQEIDPVLFPSFGHPLYPYVPVATQVEVYNMLSTFQPLLAADFVVGAFPFIPAIFPVPAGFHFHHAKIAIQAVQEEIQNVARFANQCPEISAIQPGQIVCDLTITYANAIVVTRIHKV
jgi:hypothetical protein